jgi:aminoglycoside phosphotransferase (APT) family kinase protein
VHYDCHPGNIFWAGAEPGFLDWQLVRIGEGIGDVAYFLATALEPQLRRKHEKSLLGQYVDQMANAGVAGLDADKLFRRYRMHLVYPFEAMVVTLAIGGMMQHDTNLELIRRTAAAVEDHDSFAMIKV